MKLLIFPGSASPAQPLYQEVYGLLKKRAGEFGYADVDCSLSWPGHQTADKTSDGCLTMDGAVETAVRAIRQYEHGGEPYHILARSFGNYVAVQSILEAAPVRLAKLISWAPPPYGILWQMFVRDYDATQEIARSKWLVFDESFFPSVVPLESMLPRLKVACVVATGSEDKYCSHAHLRHLGSFATQTTFTIRNEINGAPHEVHAGLGPAVVNPYLEALLH